MMSLVVLSLTGCGTTNTHPDKVNIASHRLDTKQHGLKQGVTLAGGNPVAPSFVPGIPNKQVNAGLTVRLIHPNYAYPAPKIPKLPHFVRLSAPSSVASQLAAYYFPLGSGSFYIVAPKGMTSIAQVGMDGSFDVSLKEKGEEVDLSSTGACQGCAVDAASLYFPSARKEAMNYGGYNGPYMEDLPVKLINWNSEIKLWGYTEKNHQHLAGFAYYKPLSRQVNGAFMSEVFVGTSQQVNNLAPWIFQNTMVQLWHFSLYGIGQANKRLWEPANG